MINELGMMPISILLEKPVNRYVFITLTFLFASHAAEAEIISIVDGDTIDIGTQRYRLFGIDAPEAGQKCKTVRGSEWPCGKEAIKYLEELALDKNIRCESQGIDEYERMLGICYADDIDINAKLIESGYAWAFTKYSPIYVEQEARAKAQKLGIWQAPTQTAWDYRAQRWEVAQQEAPEGCPIKGNISDHGRIYHAPWSPWYTRTKVSLNKGEKWFCSEAEALRAGWRAPYWGSRR
jgi:endonuclease YncB( thermonuclease family)